MHSSPPSEFDPVNSNREVGLPKLEQEETLKRTTVGLSPDYAVTGKVSTSRTTQVPTVVERSRIPVYTLRQMVKRLYTRYPFSASGTVTDNSGFETPAQVTTLSVGGCRLITCARLSIGERVTVRIRRDKDYFEAPANVAHCAEDGVGVMFHNESTQSLLVLTKWVEEAKSLEQMNKV